HGVAAAVAQRRGRVERDGEPGLPGVQGVVVAAVRPRGGAEARILAHGPQTAAVHRFVDAARERECAGLPQVGLRVELHVLRAVDRLDRLAAGAHVSSLAHAASTSNSIMMAPFSTACPAATATRATTPAASAFSSFSIFIASTIATPCP